VIGTFEGRLNLADYKDEYREGLQRIIDAKIAGEEVVAPTVEATPKVVNLMEALKKSLDAVSRSQKTPAKAVVEQIFALPGMGRLTVEAILYRDYPVVQTNVMLVAATLVTLNLLVDLTYAWLDPRIRYR